MTLGECGCVRRLLRSNVDRSSATSNVSDEARGWLNDTRRARRNEDRAFVQSGEDAIQVERQFAEPADVRSNATSAVAPGNLGGWFVDIGVAERGSAACVATAFEEFAVHVDDALRSSLLVKVIHILGAEEQAVTQGAFELGEREVCRIRFGFRRDTPTHRVELPDQPGIATPRVGRGDFLDSVVAPETIDATERRYPAFGAYACPCEDEESIGGRNGEHGRSEEHTSELQSLRHL